MSEQCVCVYYFTVTSGSYHVYHKPCWFHQKKEWLGRHTSLASVLETCKALGVIERLFVECIRFQTLPPALPDCKTLVIRAEIEGIHDFPDVLLRIPSLETLVVDSSVTLTRIPPSLRLRHLNVCCQQPPYWYLTPGVSIRCWVRGKLDWQFQLEDLCALIIQGLLCKDGMFKRWLTQGLYDPRLFFFIRNMLL